MKKIVVLSGAGMSAESGINTFRDAGGLWEGHDVMEVATWDGFVKNPALVLDFYNQRRAQLKIVKPNLGHELLAGLQNEYDVQIITQNVDDLHERAGSLHVMHLHGSLISARSTVDPNYVVPWHDDILLGDSDPKGNQMRPDIVWFGEDVPLIPLAIDKVKNADYIIIIGTSMQVYPAASLVNYALFETPIFYIDPKPAFVRGVSSSLTVISKGASEGLQECIQIIQKWK
jgi:NAD-dependent deacetylase